MSRTFGNGTFGSGTFGDGNVNPAPSGRVRSRSIGLHFVSSRVAGAGIVSARSRGTLSSASAGRLRSTRSRGSDTTTSED